MAEITCGHPDRRYGANGLCHSCYVYDWTKAHPDANTGNNWLKNNPERARYLRRRATLKRRFGITPEDYEQFWKIQEGKCANPGCRAEFPLIVEDYRRDGLHVDHCHKTGKIRALLCANCNIALGHACESPERLAGLVEYLARFKE